jgi:2-hydroxychromene-2-carboxylate isomerase
MNKTVELFFDLGSPASYLAWTQLPSICERAKARLQYRPMLLGGAFQATGNASPISVPAKGRYMLKGLQRHALRYAVPFAFTPHSPLTRLR